MADIAFGFVDLRELMRHRIVDVPNLQRLVRDAIARTVARHNAEANTYLAELADTVMVAKERYIMPGGGVMQTIGADDNPYPTAAYKGNDVGYPIRGAGDAMGNNRVSRQMITVQDANDMMQETRIKDKNWLIDHMIAAILTKEAYEYEDMPFRGLTGAGSVIVKGLANGDGDTYLTDRGRGVKEDDHYLFQAEPIAPSTNPLPRLRRTLTEHGQNPDATVVVYVAPNLVSPIADGLPGFVERTDPSLVYGQNLNRLSSVPSRGLGDEVIGRVDRCWIVEAERLPDNYMVGHMTGQKPLGRREYPARGLSGLFTEEFSPDGNHMETRHIRYTGFGCRNRVSAAVMQIEAGAYETPAQYAAPLA